MEKQKFHPFIFQPPFMQYSKTIFYNRVGLQTCICTTMEIHLYPVLSVAVNEKDQVCESLHLAKKPVISAVLA